MLLETLDIKKNDVLIYSQNIYDLENNFKIIYKDDFEKIPCQISYGEVCRFINEFTPKNLIVYRLLTNIPDFEIFLSRYGFFLSINGVKELIYFDPIFAVKELEDYSEKLNYDLRFRIQQVGLTTLNRLGNVPNYAEIYNVDMRAIEAKNQNDKVFADAIFSVERKKDVEPKTPERNLEKKTVINPGPSQKPDQEKSGKPFGSAAEYKIKNDKRGSKFERITGVEPFEPKLKISPGERVNKSPKPPAEINMAKPDETILDRDIRFIQHEISEDIDFDYRQIMKLNFKGSAGNENKKMDAENINSPKRKPESAFGKFLQNKQINNAVNEHVSLGDVSKDQLTEIFKSSASLKNLIEGKENQKVVLKLDKR